MGSRNLKKWLLKPLLSVEKINLRLDAVEELAAEPLLRYDLRNWLSDVRDIERLVGRIVYGNSNSRDLVALKKSLEVLPPIRDSLVEEAESELLKKIAIGLASFSDLENLAETIDRAIVDEPPISVREGGMIKPGYNAELDELRNIASSSKKWIAAFQQKERERSGIKS